MTFSEWQRRHCVRDDSPLLLPPPPLPKVRGAKMPSKGGTARQTLKASKAACSSVWRWMIFIHLMDEFRPLSGRKATTWWTIIVHLRGRSGGLSHSVEPVGNKASRAA